MPDAVDCQPDRQADVDLVLSQTQWGIQAGLKCCRVAACLLQAPRMKRQAKLRCCKSHDPAARVQASEPSCHLADEAGEKLISDGAPDLGEAIDAERSHHQQ